MAPQKQEQDQDSDFEFSCCITPESPNSDSSKNSPADLLFLNGRLQPHTFPSQSFNDTRIDRSLSTSRTSSICSNSFASSRSTSSNSRSSCSSARTSSSEYNDKKLSTLESLNAKATKRSTNPMMIKSAILQQYSTSQRWQFITPIPTLTSTTELPHRKKDEDMIQRSRSMKQVAKTTENSTLCWRLFRSFLSACRECHSLESSVKEDEK